MTSLKYKLLTFGILFQILSLQLFSQSASNIGFENGDFSGWEGGLGSCCPINILGTAIVTGRHTIMSGTGVSPNTCGNLPVVSPTGGQYSARLGNNGANYKAERLRYTYTVTPSSDLLIYKYAVVLEDPSHNVNSQPRFEIKILDATGNLIDPVCGYYKVIAQPFLPGWHFCGNIYSDWNTVGVDLSGLVGQSVTVEFTTGDCGQGGHFGYAYVDAEVTSLNIDVVYCQGANSVTLSAPEGFTYQWSNGETGQSTVIPIPVINPTIDLVLTAVTGCQVQLTAHLNSNIFIQGFLADISCSDQVLFADTLNRTNHQWDFGDGSAIVLSDPSPSHTYLNPGYYDVILISETSLGCQDTMIQQIYVPEIPQADFTFSEQCLNQSVNFTDLSTSINIPIISWQWNFGDGQTSNNQNPVHAYTSTGIYDVELIVINQDGCSDTINHNIEIYPVPLVSFSTPNVCLTNISEFTNTSSISSGTLSWDWDFGDGVHSNSFEPSHTYTADGDYTVTLIANSDHGCVNTYQMVVTIYPLPVIDFNVDDHCHLFTAPFENFSTISSGILSYHWDIGDGTQSALKNFNHQYTNTGNYNVTLTATSDHTCISSSTINVNVYPNPDIEFYGNPLFGCSPLEVELFDLSTISSGSIVNWVWSIDGNIYSGQNQTVTLSNPGLYDVFLTIISDQGCESEMLKSNYIEVYPLPVAGFIADPIETTIVNPLIHIQDLSNGGDYIKWDWGNNMYETANPGDISYLYSDTGVFNIEQVVYNTYGCSDTVYQEIIIQDELLVYIPNSFTPNADGNNDVFKVEGSYLYDKEFTFSIFNRWGEIIFEGHSPDKGWDGKYNGLDAQIDTYIYKLVIKDHINTYEYTGHVTLVR